MVGGYCPAAGLSDFNEPPRQALFVNFYYTQRLEYANLDDGDVTDFD